MNIEQEHQRLEKVFDQYQARLKTIPDDLFTVTPPAGGWSFAEVYAHILKADKNAAVAMEQCAGGKAATTNSGLTFTGKIIFLWNKLPPIKTKTSATYDSKNGSNKISKEEAANLLTKCRKQVTDAVPLLSGASKAFKAPHPIFGMLDARQWLTFIRMHSEHHLKQLNRIEKNFINI